MNSISIVIPAYNEENRIEATLKKISTYFDKKKLKYEIVVVDDGSTDSTVKTVAQQNLKNLRIIQNNENKGKGYTIKKGFLASRMDYVLFSDADLSTPIKEFEVFMNYVSDYDIIIGSRKKANSVLIVKQPFYRVFAGNIFPILVNFLIMNDFNDTQCGFKLFNRKKCLVLFNKQRLDGFGFDVEILYLAKKRKLKIKELGVKWQNDTNTKVQLVKHSLLMLIDLIKIRINDLLGRY
ncbi:MAG: dolichyl-phosphate beta-glucosyltransferase [archaeon]